MIGTSIAFHLAEAGADVCLLERDQLAGGSTSRAAGGFRAQFSDPLNIAIGLRSIEAFEQFGERPGAEIDLHQVGYLFLLDREEDVAAFEASVALQQGLGAPSRFVNLDEVQALCPIAGLDGVLAATYCPIDGHASPEAVVQGYAAGARAYGARVLTGCSLTGIRVDGSEIHAIETTLGSIETGTVICAAGAWSPEVAHSVGVDLPIQPFLREVGFTGPTAGLPDFHTSRPGTAVFPRCTTFPRICTPSGSPSRLRPVGMVMVGRPEKLQGTWNHAFPVEERLLGAGDEVVGVRRQS